MSKKILVWSYEELVKVKEFKERNTSGMTLDQMAEELSGSLGRTVPTTRARLAQIDRYIEQMENKMATPKPPIPEMFRTMVNPLSPNIVIDPITESATDVTTIVNENTHSNDESMEIPSFTEAPPDELFQFNTENISPTKDIIVTIPVTKKTTDGSSPQICKKNSIKFLSSLRPTVDDVILGERNNSKRRRCNNTNEYNNSCQKCNIVKKSIATQTDTTPTNNEEDVIFIEDNTTINNNDNINDNPPTECITIEQDAPDQTMRMAREHFGCKPFEGQQKLRAENYPSKEELIKLAREDMKKAANFILNYDKENKTKFPGKNTLVHDQTRAELRKINGAYRKFVRKTHRFRHDFPSDGMHLAPNNGGVGATDIEEKVARSIYNSSSKMIEDNTSKYFQKVVRAANIAKKRDDNAKYLKINEMDEQMELKEYHQSKLLNRISKSQRVANSAKPFFNNKRANKWIKNDRLPTKVRNDFFKLRYNIMPTNSTTHFFNGGKKKCRGCGGPSETVKHLITRCPGTKGLIMNRHNEVMKRLIKLGTRQRNTTTYQEKCFKTEDGVVKPDLVIVNGKTATIMEIAVTFEENEQSLSRMYSENHVTTTSEEYGVHDNASTQPITNQEHSIRKSSAGEPETKISKTTIISNVSWSKIFLRSYWPLHKIVDKQFHTNITIS
ncbi:hypothetical protein SNEBB_005667 [Seison nebaliae]|nr:hypothetical protein SNEBB_005667 [Seison nebaliae]